MDQALIQAELLQIRNRRREVEMELASLIQREEALLAAVPDDLGVDDHRDQIIHDAKKKPNKADGNDDAHTLAAASLSKSSSTQNSPSAGTTTAPASDPPQFHFAQNEWISQQEQELIQNAASQQGGQDAQRYLEALAAAAETAAADGAKPRLPEFTSYALESGFAPLATDCHGSVFVQRLLERASPKDLDVCLRKLRPHFLAVACLPHGARCIQHITERVTVEETAKALISLVLPHIVVLVEDANGSHVVQRLIGPRFKCSDKTELFVELTSLCLEVSKSRHGCCIMQRCLDVAPTPYREAITAKLVAGVLDLVQHPFGNYIIQYILDKNEEPVTKKFIQQLLHNIAVLACNKFGSNVIEKCLRIASTDIRQLLIDEITDPSVLPRLVQDSFANYVVQTAIQVASADQFKQLHNAIKPCATLLKHSPYGLRIQNRIGRRIRDHAKDSQRKCNKEKMQQRATAPPAPRHQQQSQPQQQQGGGQHHHQQQPPPAFDEAQLLQLHHQQHGMPTSLPPQQVYAMLQAATMPPNGADHHQQPQQLHQQQMMYAPPPMMAQQGQHQQVSWNVVPPQ